MDGQEPREPAATQSPPPRISVLDRSRQGAPSRRRTLKRHRCRSSSSGGPTASCSVACTSVSKDCVTVRPTLRAEAALLLAEPGSYLSHHTAAQLWGGTVPDHADVHVTYPRMRAQCFGIAAHRRQGAAARRPVDGPSRHRPGPDLLRPEPRARARRSRRARRLLGAARSASRPTSWSPWPRSTAARTRGSARRAARLVRAGVDSPMETASAAHRPRRAARARGGPPSPRRQRDLLRRYDLSLPQLRLIIEYDGRQHAESEEQWPTTSAGTSSSTTS